MKTAFELLLFYSIATFAVLRFCNLLLYNTNMDQIHPRLLWHNIAPGQPFHAALITPRGVFTQAHTHDFHEMFYVEEGTGTHLINGETRIIAPGDLVFIRPDDAHAFINPPGQNMYRINIAFQSDLWESFNNLANTPNWETPTMPLHVSVAAAQRGEASHTFGRALRAFHAGPTALELCRFLSEAVCLLTPLEETQPLLPADSPPWLFRACQLMEMDEHLREGLPRFLDLAGVSETHLARTLKSASGLTPTAWINQQRLTRAAALLATTPLSILDIALDCGFENLSYFYRRFGQQYGQSPHAYRLGTQRRIVPDTPR